MNKELPFGMLLMHLIWAASFSVCGQDQITRCSSGGIEEVMKTSSSLWQRKVQLFNIENGARSTPIEALGHLGLRPCIEYNIEQPKQRWFVDNLGRPIFATDRLVSLRMENETVLSITNKCIKTLGDYQWCALENSNIINVYGPKSRLNINVGAVKLKADPYRVMAVLASRNRELRFLFPPAVVRGFSLPDIELDLIDPTARDVLNEIAKGDDMMRWYTMPAAIFNRYDHSLVDDVDIRYPELREGTPKGEVLQHTLGVGSANGRRVLRVEFLPETAP